jgi:folate-binding protein YgfZ
MTLEGGYRALREGAGIGAISPREQLAVAGKDRASFLQGLLTNDIESLVPGSGCYSAWLTPQGRMLTDMHVLEAGAMILLDVPQATAAATLSRLDQFLFSEDVRLESLAESLTSTWIHGPSAAGILESLMKGAHGMSGWPDYRHAQLEMDGEPVSVARIDQLGVPGYCLYTARGNEGRVISALESAGAVRVPAGALEAARIQAGYPVFGVDMTEDTIPLEAGIEQRAISFTKGCYVGQEIIIRVLHRGGGRVARKLVGLAIGRGAPSASPPRAPAADTKAGRDDSNARSVGLQADEARGARIYSDDRDIGFVTSAAVSPALGTIALGYVHRDFAAPDTNVEIDTPGGRQPAVVTERPMRSAA